MLLCIIIHFNTKEFQGKATPNIEGNELKIKPYKLLDTFYF